MLAGAYRLLTITWTDNLIVRIWPVEKGFTMSYKLSASQLLKLFTPLCLLGLIPVRIWTQTMIYDRYFFTDYGVNSLFINFLRSVIILVFIVISLKSLSVHEKLWKWTLFASVICATIAVVLEILPGPLGIEWNLIQLFTGAFGIIWMGGCWMCIYSRLPLSRSMCIILISLACSALAGLILSYAPRAVSLMICLFTPTLSLVMWMQSFELVKKIDETSWEALKPFSSLMSSKYFGFSFVRIAIGIMLFSLTIGMARGFPSGEPLELGIIGMVLHQVGVIAFALCSVLVLIKREKLSTASLWRILISLVLIALLLLSIRLPQYNQIGSGVLTLANTFSLAVIWISALQISRLTGLKAHTILGIFWLLHLLMRELGRTTVYIFATPHDISLVLLMIIILVLCASTIFMFGSVDLTTTWSNVTLDIAQTCDEGAAISMRRTAAEENAVTPGLEEIRGAITSNDNTADNEWCTVLSSTYNLTERETDVMRLISEGRSKPYIAELLGLSENTVKSYTKALYQKLEIHSRQELIDLKERLLNR